jgi:hypothetical protein
MIRNRALAAFAVLLLLILRADDAAAQSIVVQRPVVQQFGVRTVVSIPDRGSIHLGGVGSAGIVSRRNLASGPTSSVANFRRHGDMHAHVTIHDLSDLDARVLAEAAGSRPPEESRALSGMAAHACRQLLQNHQRLPRH